MNFLATEDIEDFEQEKRIKEWLENQGIGPERDLQPYTTSKGTARNSRVRASLSLDQKIQDDSKGTFADIIGGSDGRDLCNGRPIEPEIEAREIVRQYLDCLLKKRELVLWVEKTLKCWITQNERLYQTFLIDLE